MRGRRRSRSVAKERNPVQLQLLLIAGITLIFVEIVGIVPLDLGIPVWLGIYLMGTSGYFAVDPHKRVEERREEILVYMCFPGALVTLLIPLYAILLFVSEIGLL